MAKDARDLAISEAKRLNEKYGAQTGYTAEQTKQIQKKVWSTGILSLDYALGTGGWTKGYPVEVFGPEDIGKSSAIGLSAMRSAQSNDMLCGVIALEPTIDAAWMEKNGVDNERAVIAYPNNGEVAFEILHDWVSGGILDAILFDSVGAVGSESESEGGKAKVGGNSKLITEGIRRIIMRSWKNKVGIIFLNQIRDVLDGGPAAKYSVATPGGHAIRHFCPIRVQVKPGSDRWEQKIGDSKVLIGRSLVAQVVRNKMSQGTGHRAIFNYFQMEWPGFPFGVDMANDVANTGTAAGVFKKSGGWYEHPTFPGKTHKLNGAAQIGKYLEENSDAFEQIREEVMQAMYNKAGAPLNAEVGEELEDDN